MEQWSQVEQISAVRYHSLGLREDGTVFCTGGQEGEGTCNVSTWGNIKQILGAVYHSIGLESDVTVVAIGDNNYGQLNVSAGLMLSPLRVDDTIQ